MTKNLHLNYVLSAEVIGFCLSTNRVVTRLALALKVTEEEVREWLLENKHDSKLTNVRAVDIIQQETHLTPNQILVQEGEEVAA